MLIRTCPSAVDNANCHAGMLEKKNPTVRAEKIRIADELEICRKMVVSMYLSISVPAAEASTLAKYPSANLSERK